MLLPDIFGSGHAIYRVGCQRAVAQGPICRPRPKDILPDYRSLDPTILKAGMFRSETSDMNSVLFSGITGEWCLVGIPTSVWFSEGHVSRHGHLAYK